MCGIAGFVDFSGHARGEAAVSVKRMTDTLVHRGPDGDGIYVDDFAALGHRRLAIIDIASGAQPMRTSDGEFQIVFNGEIYNFEILRRQLSSLGHEFSTHSDTEVILASYRQWGESCLQRLNGMFALAIWDTRNRTLFLARDRVGKKPLYYLRKGSIVAFASELKALRAYDKICPHDIDRESLDCYFSLGYIPAPRSIYKNVKKLPAAHSMVATATQSIVTRYWDLSYATPRSQSMHDAVEEFSSLLDEAVKCRLMSEVPLGAFLSGGVDSSLVVASMAGLLSSPVNTHTIGFGDKEFDETDIARKTAQHFGTNHHEFIVKPDASSVLDKIAWHFDEPFADSSALPTWYVCELTRRSVTVALSGDGGDEGFGGYTFRYLPHNIESKVRKVLPPALRSLMFGPIGSLWPASAKLPRPLRLKTIFQKPAWITNCEASATVMKNPPWLISR